MTTAPVSTVTAQKSVVDQDDVAAVSKILAKIGLANVVSTNRGDGDVTAAAIRLLQHAYHFLRWNGNVLRSPTEAGALVSPASISRDIEVSLLGDLTTQISKLLKYAVYVTIQNSPRDMVFGMNSALKAIDYALYPRSLKLLLSTLNWTVISSATNTVSLDIGPVKSHGKYDGLRLYLVEGLMVATVLYPSIPYVVGLDEVPLSPIYDSEMQLTLEGYAVRKYRIVVPGTGFTGHYVDDIARENQHKVPINRTPLPLAEGYFYFESQEFLQGLQTLTSTVGVQQPWIALEKQTKGTWGAADLLLPTVTGLGN